MGCIFDFFPTWLGELLGWLRVLLVRFIAVSLGEWLVLDATGVNWVYMGEATLGGRGWRIECEVR